MSGFREYIQRGDYIQVSPRSLKVDPFKGSVVAIDRDSDGQRYIVVPDGWVIATEGARSVSEYDAVISVQRTDVWIMLPLPITLAEASAKCERMAANERKRLWAKSPLFAALTTVQPRDPEVFRLQLLNGEEEKFSRDIAEADRANLMRECVRLQVTPEEFEDLVIRRQRYPASGGMGIHFWAKQIHHIQIHGYPEPKPVFSFERTA